MVASSNGFVPLSYFADRPLMLAPEDYPNQAWTNRSHSYNDWWSYYEGYKLQRRADPQNPDSPEAYPYKLNIIRPACILQAAALLGQADVSDNIVQFGLSVGRHVPRELAIETADLLNALWAVSGGDTTILEQALFQQIFGGFYYYSRWSNRPRWPIQYFPIDPRAVFPVWDGFDFSRLIAVDVMQEIPKPTAQARYGTDFFSTISAEREFVNIHEHWDENEYWVEVDGQIARWQDGSEMKGANPWFDPLMQRSIIPFVYAPRLRSGNFYGQSLIPGLIGAQDEINSNIADLSEGVADAMHQQPWVRDAPKGLQNIKNASRDEWINLGATQFGNHPPEAGRLPGAEINPAIVDFVMEDMIRLIREHNGSPDVVWGKTDASIRSALTLAFMMKPYTDYAFHYRRNAAQALKTLCYNSVVQILSKKGFYATLNATEAMLEAILIAHRTTLPPVLPQDRIDRVNEVVQRIAAKIISRETAIRMLDGDEDIEQELSRIEDQIEQEFQQARELNQFANQTRQQQQPGSRSNRQQADGGRTSSR